MAGFKFERNLPHQVEAVKSIMRVYDGAQAKSLDEKAMAVVANPVIVYNPNYIYCDNIFAVQKKNGIPDKGYFDCKENSTGLHTLDIMMETGTGKTYTYTKAMFELNKQLGIKKFVVVVPTLSIKAGTVNFLKGKATNEHFRQEYGSIIKTYIVESQKKSKSKKAYMPQAVREFVEAHDDGNVHVLVINAGMINSDTMSKKFDVSLFDRYNTPFGAIASVNPFTIIDEPHKFPKEGVTYGNIQKFRSQFIFRFGATFNNQYHNLIYRLSAVDAFNKNLVKGVITYVEEFNKGEDIYLKLTTLPSKESKEIVFIYNNSGKKTRHTIVVKESMAKLHGAMQDLYIEAANTKKILLSNGLELKKGDTINPYSYAQSLQDKMIQQTVANHFKIEKELLTRDVRIKPLTLFFIDDIEGYRDGNEMSGSLKEKFETLAKIHIEKLLKEVKDERYKAYLEASLKDVSLIHGGYFSKDNSEKDEKIEKEITEILHDKEALLSLDNPRRFIFSKWTLREGWDNPNVFQICKLRGSGSTTSKLQEVGRGLRLPVNEYMSRVKDENFDLHYFVDFSEKDFVKTLVAEINEKSGAYAGDEVPEKLTPKLVEKITQKYSIDEATLFQTLGEVGIIDFGHKFIDDGFEKLKSEYADAFGGLTKSKVRGAREKKEKVTLRIGKYDELKTLWEQINQKVVLEYKIDTEEGFSILFKGYLEDNLEEFEPQGVKTRIGSINFEDGAAYYKEIESVNNKILPVSTMHYKAFLMELSRTLNLNMQTLHQVFLNLKEKLDINIYLNIQTVRIIKNGFNRYLLSKSMDKFSIGYNTISNEVHPTKLTDKEGKPLESINASEVGVYFVDDEKVADSYCFNELYYDSDLEKENIVKNIEEVIVFTKIPKNSIKIPVAGGGTYSPDFAYVIKNKQEKKTLYLIVETKGKQKDDLNRTEEKKIAHAKKLFEDMATDVKIEFKKQLKSKEIVTIIKEAIDKDLQ